MVYFHRFLVILEKFCFIPFFLFEANETLKTQLENVLFFYNVLFFVDKYLLGNGRNFTGKGLFVDNGHIHHFI